MNSVKDQSTYLHNTCDDIDDIVAFNINFVIQNFNGQIILPTDNCQNALFAVFKDITGLFKEYRQVAKIGK